jgi:AcrR family transcriptional regulator
MAPEARAAAIVDAARDIVLDEGVANVTMQRIAVAAGVSKGLVYAYFPNITALLREVYLRESRVLARQHMHILRAPLDFEQMAKATAQINRTAANESRLLIKRLSADPTVGQAMASARNADRESVLRVLCEQVTNSYLIPAPIARKAVMLALGYDEEDPAAKADSQLDEIWGAMMTGAMRELEQRYKPQELGK